jgi:hypothetical protein
MKKPLMALAATVALLTGCNSASNQDVNQQTDQQTDTQPASPAAAPAAATPPGFVDANGHAPDPLADHIMGGPCYQAEVTHDFAKAAKLCEPLGDAVSAKAKQTTVAPQRFAYEDTASQVYHTAAVDELETEYRDPSLTYPERRDALAHAMHVLDEALAVVQECAGANATHYKIKHIDDLINSCKLDVANAQGQRADFERQKAKILGGRPASTQTPN